ncbi:2-succinyl-5-enolpyruvyl-6-hydroxy-3-cyclohexene-1-carboxylate synthase [Salsuginibacillus halophilus]|uniref:2-succinyl-5-enolpyruvyl-6-hydroxy-3-cyclohexene-1-carboxylate synthase n=1 Tax=Salsuginibacillus halophilus TaxID=517424 RepID=A0A2P8HWG1_9BACI|nr:2-succinyl-5-enolpyruvyl-6-hydroxy-3-cyclohexene-1-carboxylic-acid synthase [Salsuginibacillus halophilus]PSL50518.1 2-succinyl-5-enolpyruvyl-6-hydroxy-3-cyclohexene-1-carboxylate synthase [Salsuginibacillus halophilus]
MNMGEGTYYLAYMIDELYQQGVREVVISPGSRSTPLSLLAREHPGINVHVHFDERAAAFVALGISKATQTPAALICTSGTAAANYYPAVIEAKQSRVPLIVLTSDRPNELRDNGAPQTIDQLKMFGDAVKYFHELDVPDPTERMLAYARSQAARACQEAATSTPGPVHLNVPLREPLLPETSLPNLWGASKIHLQQFSVRGRALADVTALEHVLTRAKRPIIVCGELDDRADEAAVLRLAESWQVPVFADVLSNLRGQSKTAGVISTFDTLLKSSEVTEKLTPDVIIRFGTMPVAKSYAAWLSRTPWSTHIVVDPDGGYREPAGVETILLPVQPHHFVQQVSDRLYQLEADWLEAWQKVHESVLQTFMEPLAGGGLTEAGAASALNSVKHGLIFTSNSMPVRDLNTFYHPEETKTRIMANRGANGIDGVISTALGAAAAGYEVTLLIGDLAFLHDYTTLFFAKKAGLSLRVVVINNDGGGIFSFLPQREGTPHFEEVFSTSFQPPVAELAAASGASFKRVAALHEFTSLLSEPLQGIEIIEIVTDREENRVWHEKVSEAAVQAAAEVVRR